MQACIQASALNVRALPAITGRILGALPKDTVVSVRGENKHWLEIDYKQHHGFISRHYTKLLTQDTVLHGVVAGALLNVRRTPAAHGEILGTLVEGSQVSIVSVYGAWLEIEFNEQTAFVHKDYINRYTPAAGFSASVNTTVLNVRSLPSSRGNIVGRVSYGTLLSVVALHQIWAEIRFSGQTAFVSMQYLEVAKENADETSPLMVNRRDDDGDVRVASLREGPQPLSPSRKLPIRGSTQQINVARAWNQFGALLQTLSETKGIEPACAVAVLSVESSGKGFEQNNQNRMIIRFENHKFWRYWGRNNADSFRQYFRYSSEKVWTQHQWRRSKHDPWQSFHGKQAAEWQVFEFARSLNEEAAMMSISMGAPQIMGFHFERIHYPDVQAMFHDFNADIGAHIRGLFDFFSPSMVNNLQQKKFENFAAAYNGSGQKEKYGRWINEHYRAFKRIFN